MPRPGKLTGQVSEIKDSIGVSPPNPHDVKIIGISLRLLFPLPLLCLRASLVFSYWCWCFLSAFSAMSGSAQVGECGEDIWGGMGVECISLSSVTGLTCFKVAIG